MGFDTEIKTPLPKPNSSYVLEKEHAELPVLKYITFGMGTSQRA